MGLFFLGMLPLLVFVILDSFSSLRMSILSALTVGAVGVALSCYYTGGIEWLSVLLFLLFVVMGLLSIKMKKSIIFKFQPVVVSGLLATVLFVSHLVRKPLFVVLSDKYHDLLMEAPLIKSFIDLRGVDAFRAILTTGTLGVSLSLFLYAVLVALAAWKLSNWSWLVIKGFGLYVIIGVVMGIQFKLFPP